MIMRALPKAPTPVLDPRRFSLNKKKVCFPHQRAITKYPTGVLMVKVGHLAVTLGGIEGHSGGLVYIEC